MGLFAQKLGRNPLILPLVANAKRVAFLQELRPHTNIVCISAPFMRQGGLCIFIQAECRVPGDEQSKIQGWGRYSVLVPGKNAV